LVARERTGRGQRIDISASFFRRGDAWRRHGGPASYQTYWTNERFRGWRCGTGAGGGGCRRGSRRVLYEVVTASAAGGDPVARAATHCGRVTITPQSGDVLYNIHARGIGCRSARRALRAWGRNGYQPIGGPRGYRCRTVRTYAAGNSRRLCRASSNRRRVISFDTGV
jgi:hypothetical protein